jgi:hypothetical protein
MHAHLAHCGQGRKHKGDVAAILRNSRRTARYFASTLAGRSAELHFALRGGIVFGHDQSDASTLRIRSCAPYAARARR